MQSFFMFPALRSPFTLLGLKRIHFVRQGKHNELIRQHEYTFFLQKFLAPGQIRSGNFEKWCQTGTEDVLKGERI